MLSILNGNQYHSWHKAEVLILGALIPIVVSLIGAPVQAQENALLSDQLSLIEKTTNETVRAEIQLMQLSTRYHAAWVKPNQWKSWRVFAYKMAGSSLTNAGIITIAASRFQYADNPSKAPRPYLKAGHIVNLTAASVLVGGTLIESLLDRLSERRIHRENLDPRSAMKRFLDLREKLDSLLSLRKSYVNDCNALTLRQREILDADGQVLQDLRDLASIEFGRIYCEVAGIRSLRDLSNVTAFLSASTAGYMGSLDSLLSVANRKTRQTGVAGLGFITSGASVAASPLITSLGSKIASKRAAQELKESNIYDADQLTLDQFEQHRQLLERLSSGADPAEKLLLKALDTRRSVYQLHNAILNARSDARLIAKRTARRDLAERLFFSSIVGGTNIARGTQLAIAGFHYYDSSKDVFRLVASASTAFIAGSGVWTVDNLQGKIREELLNKRLKTAKLSVHAKLATDLENLQLMEDQMSVY